MIQTDTQAVSTPESTTTDKKQWLVLGAAFLGWMFDGLEMGIFPLTRRRPCPARHDAGGRRSESLCRPVDRANHRHVPGRSRARWRSLWVARGSHWTGPGDDIQHSDLLDFQRPMLFRPLRFSVRRAPFNRCARHGRRMGIGGGSGHGKLWPKDKRPLLAGIIGAAANVGFVLIAVLGLRFKVSQDSWRWVMLAGAAPAVLTFFIQMFGPGIGTLEGIGEEERFRFHWRRLRARHVEDNTFGHRVRFNCTHRNVGLSAMATVLGRSIDRRQRSHRESYDPDPVRRGRHCGMYSAPGSEPALGAGLSISGFACSHLGSARISSVSSKRTTQFSWCL